MNTAVTVALIICATLIFFAVLGFISSSEERVVKKKELEIRQAETITKQMEYLGNMPEDFRNLFLNNKKSEERKK